MIRHKLSVLMSLMFVGQSTMPVLAAGTQPDVNFKIYSPGPSSSDSDTSSTTAAKPVNEPPAPESSANQSTASTPATANTPDTASPTATASPSASTDGLTSETAKPDNSTLTPTSDSSSTPDAAKSTSEATPSPAATTESTDSTPTTTSVQSSSDSDKNKALQGYIRVVPVGTKIPIIMDTAVDSDTSQEGDEFSARTGEDLMIDGQCTVPAGSVIKGRIAQLNAPRRLDRPGSVALKFDTVTTPDNRQIPLVANLVARGGVVHARRGVKDIAIETGIFALPTAAGLGIGLIAGNSSKSLGAGGGAVIGAGIGAAVGIAILLSKKGKKIDMRPGDELKIELAEDLRMPI